MKNALAAVAVLALSLTASASEFTGCQTNAAGEYTTNVSELKSGDRASGGYWAEAQGCVVRPIEQAWTAAHSKAFMHWNSVNEARPRQVQAPEGYTHAYDVEYKTTRIITVNWVMSWKHKLLAGTAQEPTLIEITYEKTAGTPHLRHWQGHIQLKEFDHGVVAFKMRNEFDGQGVDKAAVEKAVRDAHHKLATLQTPDQPDNPTNPEPVTAAQARELCRGLRSLGQQGLDAQYTQAAAGRTPVGSTHGCVVGWPENVPFNANWATLLNFFWRGKVFDPENKTLKNNILGFEFAVADVYNGPSLLDDKESIIIDYRRERLPLINSVRDEIREVAPNRWLGRAYVRNAFGSVMAIQFALFQ